MICTLSREFEIQCHLLLCYCAAYNGANLPNSHTMLYLLQYIEIFQWILQK